MELEGQILGKIVEKAAELFRKNPGELGGNTRFAEDLGAKSVDLVKIITVLEDTYDVEINFMEFRRKKTFVEAAAYVATLCEG